MPWVREAAGGITGTGFIVTVQCVLTSTHIVAVAIDALGEVAKPPVGTLRLVSFVVRDEEDPALDPFGRESVSYLTYSATHPRPGRFP